MSTPARIQNLRRELERQYGLRNVRPEWIRRQTDFSADELKQTITRTDICQITTGTLPFNIIQANSIPLGTDTLVQIDDIINIARPDPRDFSNPRVLQLTLTDGIIDFVGIELIPGVLRPAIVPGTKIILKKNIKIRRGRVLLGKNDFQLLPGSIGNVWGEQQYSNLVREARTQAGLPPDSAEIAAASLGRVLDDQENNDGNQLVWNGNDLGALPMNIGGIADPALLTAGEEAENGVIISQQQPTTTRAINTNNQQSNQINSNANQLEHEQSINEIQNSNQNVPPQQTPTGVEEPDEVMQDIPDVPDLESDDDRELNEMLALGSQGIQIPSAPLSRLSDKIIHKPIRAYAKVYNANRRASINEDREAIHRVVIDDGNMVRNVTLGEELTQKILSNAKSTIRNKRGTADTVAEQFKINVKGLIGFFSINIEHQKKIKKQKRESMVTREKAEVLLVDMDDNVNDGSESDYENDLIADEVNDLLTSSNLNDELKCFAENVEARLIKFLAFG